jgi:hypothetical protein
MKLSMLTLAGCLVLSPAAAQQTYDSLKRDNPFGSAEQQQQAVGTFGFCWMSGPVPNTKQVMITNVFQTQQSASTLQAELESYERGLGTNAGFECTVDMSQVQHSRSNQKISSLLQQGYSIGKIDVRPH